VSLAHRSLRLGRIGAWLNPGYGDDARTGFAIQAESLGYPTAWLGFGRAPVSDLALAERILDATSAITVATGIVNMWTNDAADVAASYRRIAARHSDRFLLGIGIGHPESVTAYRQPHTTMVNYLDQLDAGGVPPDRRILAALGPRALRLAAALLGGIDSPLGAVIGGFTVGVLENLAGAYVVGTELKLATALALIVGVLLFRPTGLFGQPSAERV